MDTVVFWKERWDSGQIGFHEGRVNDSLVAHGPTVLPAGARVLVPLCGKTRDLAWLRDRGHAVVGVELVEAAVGAYFAESGCEPTRSRLGPFVAWTGDGVTILQGDLFAAHPGLLGTFGAWWDRAAMVALPPERRGAYASLLRSLLSPGAVGLQAVLEYDPAKRSGPPFSITEAEVEREYGGWTRLRRIERTSVLEDRDRQQGLDWFDQHLWEARVPGP